MLCNLPDEIIKLISSFINDDHKTLVNFKLICKSTYNTISAFTIAKLMLSNKLGVFSFCYLCINPECYEDTYSVFTFIHNYYYTRYLHYRQYALNDTSIIVNAKSYNIHSHYCCECFKKFVLVGSNPNVVENYNKCEQVNVAF
jgi:hypothetical protein